MKSVALGVVYSRPRPSYFNIVFTQSEIIHCFILCSYVKNVRKNDEGSSPYNGEIKRCSIFDLRHIQLASAAIQTLQKRNSIQSFL